MVCACRRFAARGDLCRIRGPVRLARVASRTHIGPVGQSARCDQKTGERQRRRVGGDRPRCYDAADARPSLERIRGDAAPAAQGRRLRAKPDCALAFDRDSRIVLHGAGYRRHSAKNGVLQAPAGDPDRSWHHRDLLRADLGSRQFRRFARPDTGAERAARPRQLRRTRLLRFSGGDYVCNAFHVDREIPCHRAISPGGGITATGGRPVRRGGRGGIPRTAGVVIGDAGHAGISDQGRARRGHEGNPDDTDLAAGRGPDEAVQPTVGGAEEAVRRAVGGAGQTDRTDIAGHREIHRRQPRRADGGYSDRSQERRREPGRRRQQDAHRRARQVSPPGWRTCSAARCAA